MENAILDTNIILDKMEGRDVEGFCKLLEILKKNCMVPAITWQTIFEIIAKNKKGRKIDLNSIHQLGFILRDYEMEIIFTQHLEPVNLAFIKRHKLYQWFNKLLKLYAEGAARWVACTTDVIYFINSELYKIKYPMLNIKDLIPRFIDKEQNSSIYNNINGLFKDAIQLSFDEMNFQVQNMMNDNLKQLFLSQKTLIDLTLEKGVVNIKNSKEEYIKAFKKAQTDQEKYFDKYRGLLASSKHCFLDIISEIEIFSEDPLDREAILIYVEKLYTDGKKLEMNDYIDYLNFKYACSLNGCFITHDKRALRNFITITQRMKNEVMEGKLLKAQEFMKEAYL